MKRLTNVLVIAAAVIIVVAVANYPKAWALALLVYGLLALGLIGLVAYLVDALRPDPVPQPSSYERSAYGPEGCAVEGCPGYAVTLFAPLNLRVCTGHDQRLAAAYSAGELDEVLGELNLPRTKPCPRGKHYFRWDGERYACQLCPTVRGRQEARA